MSQGKVTHWNSLVRRCQDFDRNSTNTASVFQSNHETAPRKSGQGNKENEKRKKEGQFRRTSEDFNCGAARCAWFVRFIGRICLHHC